ncbi:MAG: ribosome assembly RNA-binding protein YhbY [bacterium]
MLTGKQKSTLRSIAHNLNALFQVGKDGVNENMVFDILKYLDKHELLKVSILQNCNQDKKEIAEIFEENEIEVVQIIGKTVVLYKQSNNAINPIKL